MFEKVVKLNSSQRVDTGQDRFVEFLTRLRDGNNTHEDWQWITEKCSLVNRTPLDLQRFYTLDSISLYDSNDEIIQHNIKKLKELQNHIVKIVVKK